MPPRSIGQRADAMPQIRPSSATIATVYTHFIIFVIVAVFNFTVLGAALPINFNFGICIAFLALTSLLLGVTAQDSEETLLRSLLMTISAMWTGFAIYHIVQSFANAPVTASETLFAGFGCFLLIYLLFIGGALHHNDRMTATLALGMFLSCIFEIAALWSPVRRSAAAYYLLLSALALYLVLSKLWAKFRRKNKTSVGYSSSNETSISKDYIPVAHAMNSLGAAVFAGQITGIYGAANRAFCWALVAGCYQLVLGVVAVRRFDLYNGVYFFLHGLFWFTNGFNLAVVFTTNQDLPFLTASTIIYFILFALIAVISLTKELYQMIQSLVLCILCVAILVDTNSVAFVGAMGWVLLILSLYTLAAHLSRVKNSGWKLPLGARLITFERLTQGFIDSCKCCAGKLTNRLPSANAQGNSHLYSTDFTLGYSRYGSFDAAGFGINAVASAAILWSPNGAWVLPWSIVLGGLCNMVVGSVCWAKGLSFESCCFFLFGSVWLIWGPARGFGTLANDNSAAVITGIVGLLAAGLLLFGLSSTISKAWSAVTFTFNLVMVGLLLNAVNANGAFIYEIVINVIFIVVCVYCFIAFALKDVWGRELLPLGRPFLQVSYLNYQGLDAFWADGRTASGVKAIADIMNRGGICGIPTDVVYVLVSALKFPQSIERAYLTKKEAEDRPMSMWISKVEQIEEGRELFGEMVWGLMNEIWPSTVSLVIPKGDWYTNLGVGDSGKYVGRPDSIACRMPDNTVTSHLIDQTGPVATTSANPTGEADTTHHLQVLAKLGLENVDGILCSGPSPENMASTVVDCRQLSEGKVAFFRIGVVPRSHVEAVIAKVRAYHDGSVLPAISRSSGAHDNVAFESDEPEDQENVRGNSVVGSGSVGVGGHSDGDGSGGNSNNVSFNQSFVESTTEDDADLIRRSPNQLDNDRSSRDYQNGLSANERILSHLNKVYESIAPLGPIRQSLYEGSKVSTEESMSGQLGSSNNVNNPYEPMQVIRSSKGVELVSVKKQISGGEPERELEFMINPVFIAPKRNQN